MIPKTGLVGREGHAFEVEDELIDTANAAWLLGMPLLLTGEPGCGKTDFAFAVARWWAGSQGKAWDRQGMLQATVRSDSRAKDLLYSYDAVRRFADAQGQLQAHAGDVRRYIELAPLGIALHSAHRDVVLIDEIDKAPRDLPNDILRELDQGLFQIAEIAPGVRAEPLSNEPHKRLQREMGRPDRAPADRPFVIITSNAERQLPKAFLRRCVFYELRAPGTERLRKILGGSNGWFPDIEQTNPGLTDAAIAIYQGLRRKKLKLMKKPSTSELINWVDAVRRMHADRVPDIAATDPEHLENLPLLGLLLKLGEDRRRVARGAG